MRVPNAVANMLCGPKVPWMTSLRRQDACDSESMLNVTASRFARCLLVATEMLLAAHPALCHLHPHLPVECDECARPLAALSAAGGGLVMAAVPGRVSQAVRRRGSRGSSPAPSSCWLSWNFHAKVPTSTNQAASY